MIRVLIPLLLLGEVLIGSPALAQVLPVTTASEKAREHFLLGRDAAHHYQFAEAREHLEQAIAADPAFVLAHLHRGGSAAYRSELEDYLGRAQAHRDRVSPGEQQMIDAFRAFSVGAGLRPCD
jgi:Tfp pilus assembly protein PilF